MPESRPPIVPFPDRCSWNASDWKILSRQWFPIVAASAVADAPVAVTLLDVGLVVYRLGGSLHVAQDRCPHRGVPLSLGCIEGEQLICAYHGLHFGADGGCTRIPAHPTVRPSRQFSLALLPVVERYGLVWTCLDPEDGEPRIPEFPAWNAPGVLSILLPHVDIAAAAGRQIEGFLDVAHFAWVHRNSFADRNDVVVPAYTTQTTDFGMQAEYWSSVSNYTPSQQHREPEGFRWLRLFKVYPPFAASLTVHFPGEDRLWILNLASPVSAERTRLFVPWARNFEVDGPREEIYAFNAQVFAEDQAIVERQQPRRLPLEPAAEPSFGADRSSMAYRKLLREMGLTLTND